MNPRTLCLAIGAGLLTAALSAGPFPEGYDRYLVPTYIEGELPGAYGSQWVTDFSLLNTSGVPAMIEGYSQGCQFDPCVPVPTPPGVTLHPRLNFWAEPDILGIYLFVEKGKTAAFNLRLRDVSRGDESFGTEIPVVPESRARSGTLNILGVPVDPRYRVTLRVYDFEPWEGSSATVRIYKENGAPLSDTPDTLLLRKSAPFAIAHSGLGTAGHPGLAQLIDFGVNPALAGAGRVRIEVESTATSSRLWAMVSITNNTTQFVTIATSDEQNELQAPPDASEVATRNVYRGYTSQTGASQRLLVSDSAEFERLWRSLWIYGIAPQVSVDFEHEMVLVSAMGGGACDETKIQSVTRRDAGLLVSITDREMDMNECGCVSVALNPIHIVAVKRDPSPVSFSVEKIVRCQPPL